jgi:hypothetical protein
MWVPLYLGKEPDIGARVALDAVHKLRVGQLPAIEELRAGKVTMSVGRAGSDGPEGAVAVCPVCLEERVTGYCTKPLFNTNALFDTSGTDVSDLQTLPD